MWGFGPQYCSLRTVPMSPQGALAARPRVKPDLCLGFDTGEQSTTLGLRSNNKASLCVALGLGPQQECCVTDIFVCQLVGGPSVFKSNHC